MWCDEDRSVPEIFSMAEELLEVMRPKAYDDLLLTYLNVMCPKNGFASSKMRRPRVVDGAEMNDRFRWRRRRRTRRSRRG